MDQDLRDYLQAMEGRIMASQDGLRANLNGVRADIMERIDRLQSTMGEMREDMTVNMGSVSQIWRAIAADRDAMAGVRETLTVLQRQVQRLREERDDAA